MPGCRGCTDKCSCVIKAGQNVAVTGRGTATEPYVIAATAVGGGGTAMPAGAMTPYGAALIPAGWLECNGQAVSRSTYATLFAAIGITHGAGNGSTTFNVPDLRQRFVYGAGGTGGAALGSTGGAATTTLVIANLPAHTHTIAHTHSISHDHAAFNTGSGGAHDHDGAGLQIKTSQLQEANHTHNAPGSGGTTSANGGFSANNNQSVSRGSSGGDATGAPLVWTNSGAHVHTINIPGFSGVSGGSSAPNSGSVGSAAEFSRMPPYLALPWIIKT